MRSAFKFVGWAFTFAFCHMTLLAASGSILIGRGIHRLDHPQFQVTALDRACQILVLILEEPYESLRRIAHVPEGWINVIPGYACSFLWGSVAAFVLLKMQGVRTKARLTRS